MSINFTQAAFTVVASASALKVVKDYYNNCHNSYAYNRERLTGSYNPFSPENQYCFKRNMQNSFHALLEILGAASAASFLASGTSNEFKLAAATTCATFAYLHTSERSRYSATNLRQSLRNIDPVSLVSAIKNFAIAVGPIALAGSIAKSAMSK